MDETSRKGELGQAGDQAHRAGIDALSQIERRGPPPKLLADLAAQHRRLGVGAGERDSMRTTETSSDGIMVTSPSPTVRIV